MSKEKGRKTGKPYWEGKEYSFYNHKKCEFFLAMKLQIRKILTACFTLLSSICFGSKCGGNFKYRAGDKDCSDCKLPHKRKNYGYIMSKYQEIMELAKKTNSLYKRDTSC